MPILVCPSCRAKFTSSGSGRVTCPTCGDRVGGSAPSRVRDDDRPVRKPPRRRDDDDDDLSLIHI